MCFQMIEELNGRQIFGGFNESLNKDISRVTENRSCPSLPTNGKTQYRHFPPQPLFGVMVLVTFHISIIKNHPKLFSNYYPTFTFFGLFTPFYSLNRSYMQITFPKH